jgi:hypothetical protein
MLRRLWSAFLLSILALVSKTGKEIWLIVDHYREDADSGIRRAISGALWTNRFTLEEC